MPALGPALNPKSSGLRANPACMAERLAAAQAQQAQVIAESRSKRTRCAELGQLLPRRLAPDAVRQSSP